MRTQTKIELVIFEWELWQGGCLIASNRAARFVVVLKYLHRVEPRCSQRVRIRKIGPYVTVEVTFYVRNDGFVSLFDSGSDLRPGEKVERIDRDQSLRFTQSSQFRVEAGWAISASEQPSLQVGLRKSEHPPILIQ